MKVYRKPRFHVVGFTAVLLKGFGAQMSDIFFDKFNPR
jgi:hypothetical protein